MGRSDERVWDLTGAPLLTHLMVLLWAVVLAVGITAVAVTWIHWRQERLQFLRHYRLFLILANLPVIGLLVATYLAANLSDVITPDSEPSVAPFFLVFSFWMVAAFVHELVVVALTLTGRELSVRVRRWAVTALGVFPVVVLAAFAAAGRVLPALRVFAISEALNVTVVVAGMAIIVVSLMRPGPPAPAHYQRVVRWFCALHLVAFVVIGVAAKFAYPPAWFMLIASFLIINVTPLATLETLILQRRASPPAGAEGNAALVAFATRHGISEREREIVRLMLGGCTNQEIASALFISSHTVKNHVYNVYRKVGVKNRVQLANLVHGPSGGS